MWLRHHGSTGVLAAAVAIACGFSVLYSTGFVGLTRKPNHIFIEPGCICHDQNTGVRVWITGPESLAAGQRALYTLSIAKDSNIAAGFDVATFLGNLEISDSAATQLLRPNDNPDDSLELTHRFPKHADGHDTISWEFAYEAPPTADVVDTLYADGNSVDLSQDPSGDAWNFAENFLVHVTPTSHAGEEQAPKAFALKQNYPNPFNPDTRILFETPSTGRVTVTVFDVQGRIVGDLVDGIMGAGTHEATFSTLGRGGGPAFSSGVYFCRLVLQVGDGTRTKSLSATRKMLLLK